MDSVVHLVRHGRVHNPDKIRYGLLAGFGLSLRGRKQIHAAGRFLFAHARRPKTIVSSPLQRALETAKILAQHLELAEPVIDPRVIEAPSQFDGLPKTAVLRPSMWPRLANPRLPSWGEPFAAVAARARAAIEEHRLRGDIAIVSHQAPIWLVRNAYEPAGPPWLAGTRCTPGSVTSLWFEHDRFVRTTYWSPPRFEVPW